VTREKAFLTCYVNGFLCNIPPLANQNDHIPRLLQHPGRLFFSKAKRDNRVWKYACVSANFRVFFTKEEYRGRIPSIPFPKEMRHM